MFLSITLAPRGSLGLCQHGAVVIEHILDKGRSQWNSGCTGKVYYVLEPSLSLIPKVVVVAASQGEDLGNGNRKSSDIT